VKAGKVNGVNVVPVKRMEDLVGALFG
jgi:hypothetical protein